MKKNRIMPYEEAVEMPDPALLFVGVILDGESIRYRGREGKEVTTIGEATFGERDVEQVIAGKNAVATPILANVLTTWKDRSDDFINNTMSEWAKRRVRDLKSRKEQV